MSKSKAKATSPADALNSYHLQKEVMEVFDKFGIQSFGVILKRDENNVIGAFKGNPEFACFCSKYFDQEAIEQVKSLENNGSW